jgi:hypothetical protein
MRTFFFVILASIWAGLSRINWIPFPGLFATFLYLTDTTFDGENWFTYLKIPFIWVIAGGISAFSSKIAFQALSGEPASSFTSHFTSALLWERLLPNATFGIGILLGILLVCLPLSILITWFVGKYYKSRIHWLRWFGLTGILSVFLVGGLIVSTKIGGGSNLHNLDAFLILFITLSLSILSGRLIPDKEVSGFVAFGLNNLSAWNLLLVVFVPFLFTFLQAGTWVFEDANFAREEVMEIQHSLDKLEDQPGEVLFIAERQLLTFGDLEGVKLIPEYEKVMIMEMAMANNREYLEQFYRLLNDHYFKAIFLDTMNTELQGPERGFNEENNSYVERVILPILKEYELVQSWHSNAMNLLIPIGKESMLQSLEENP